MSKSPIFCEHANEMPAICTCDDDCYCKEHSCKQRKQTAEHSCEQRKQTAEDICKEVLAEYYRATSLHGSFNSTHEGYAIIKEEVDELWDEVKKNGSPKALREEAIQIAAMAIRFCTDLPQG